MRKPDARNFITAIIVARMTGPNSDLGQAFPEKGAGYALPDIWCPVFVDDEMDVSIKPHFFMKKNHSGLG